MAVRDDITFIMSSSPRVILVNKNGDTSRELTIQDLVDTIRDFEDDPLSMAHDHLIEASGKEALGGSVFVGITATLQNAQVGFESRPGPTFVQCSISGGNLVAVGEGDTIINPIYTTNYVQVVLTSSSSATLQELQDVQYSSYNNGVTVNTSSSYSGTSYPTGTPRQPVNNFTDAMTIATSRGFATIYVIGEATLDSGGDYSSMRFVGESVTRTKITVNSGANVMGCEFIDTEVLGALDGDIHLFHCLLSDLDYIYGVVESCILTAGTIVLGGDQAAYFLDCWSGVPGAGAPVIDMGDSGQALNIRNYNGGIKLINKNGSDNASIDINSGQVILDSTVTGGTVVIRGVGKLTDNSTGATIQSEWLVQGGDLVVTREMTTGNREIVNNREYFYNYTTGDTEMAFILLDESGDSTMTNVYKRIRFYPA